MPLVAGGAVAVDRDAGQVVHPGEHRDRTAEVVAPLSGGLGSAEDQVLDRRGSSSGTLVSAGGTIWVARSSGRMSFSDPLTARPIGDQAVETMTASRMNLVLTLGWLLSGDGLMGSGCPGMGRRPAVPREFEKLVD
jgi:hypothetical protein